MKEKYTSTYRRTKKVIFVLRFFWFNGIGKPLFWGTVYQRLAGWSIHFVLQLQSLCDLWQKGFGEDGNGWCFVTNSICSLVLQDQNLVYRWIQTVGIAWLYVFLDEHDGQWLPWRRVVHQSNWSAPKNASDVPSNIRFAPGLFGIISTVLWWTSVRYLQALYGHSHIRGAVHNPTRQRKKEQREEWKKKSWDAKYGWRTE